jgi:hypothetical protein
MVIDCTEIGAPPPTVTGLVGWSSVTARVDRRGKALATCMAGTQPPIGSAMSR